jgi:anti-sigma B factor antagonist
MGRRDVVFGVDGRQTGDVMVVSVTGELDMATAPTLHEAVERAQGQGPIIVDLRHLTFIDSSGIRALIQIYTAGQDGHSSVSFIRAPDRVQRVLQIVGVERFLAWTEPPAEDAGDATSSK